MLYTIWMEGYAATGEHGTAQKLGEYEAESFKDAVNKYVDSDSKNQQLYSYNKILGNHYIWGCQLYDNEQDARKSFG